MGATGAWNLDMSRHARERIPPADYLASSYYDIWRKGLERLLVEHGLATPEELAAGTSIGRARAPAAQGGGRDVSRGACQRRADRAPGAAAGALQDRRPRARAS